MSVPMDARSAGFVSTDRRYLEASVGDMPTSPHTPAAVAAMLLRARNQYLLSGADYDNFVDAFWTCLKAIELLLRTLLGSHASEKATLGNLIDKASSLNLVTEHQHDYLRKFVLYFRNELAHPDRTMVFTPGLSEQLVTGCHRFVVDLVDKHFRPT